MVGFVRIISSTWRGETMRKIGETDKQLPLRFDSSQFGSAESIVFNRSNVVPFARAKVAASSSSPESDRTSDEAIIERVLKAAKKLTW